MAGGMHGGGHVWQESCMTGGVHGRGCAWQGACMAGGMHGRGHVHGMHAPPPADTMIYGDTVRMLL